MTIGPAIASSVERGCITHPASECRESSGRLSSAPQVSLIHGLEQPTCTESDIAAEISILRDHTPRPDCERVDTADRGGVESSTTRWDVRGPGGAKLT